jgi:Ni2+-binding GTPase involved in maturation of urease and hydrogenase
MKKEDLISQLEAKDQSFSSEIDQLRNDLNTKTLQLQRVRGALEALNSLDEEPNLLIEE